MKTHNVSDENRKKLSEKAKLQWQNPDFRKKTMAASNTPEAHAKVGIKLRGRKFSPETIEKMRQAALGRKQSPETVAKRVAKNTGRKRTEAFRLARSGQANIRWNGGTSAEWMKERATPEVRTWKRLVLKSQPFCQKCGSDKKLRAHHLYSFAEYPALRTDPDNGIVLCSPHHVEFHKTYGYGKNTPVQMMEYLKPH